MADWQTPQSAQLFAAILSLQTADEAARFFRDLLTEGEIAEFATRWQAARLLHAGRSYSQIEQETGLSSATIARIAKWLHTGEGGYRLVLERSHRP